MSKEAPKHVASMINEVTRLKSFFSLISWSGFNYNIRNGPIRLAKQGIFYHDEHNILICFICKKETDIDELQNIIIILHTSTCPFKDGSRNNSVSSNIPIQHPDDDQCQLINNELCGRYCENDSNSYMSISQENSGQAPRDSLIRPFSFNNNDSNRLMSISQENSGQTPSDSLIRPFSFNNDSNRLMSISQENSGQTPRDSLFGVIQPLSFNNVINNPFNLISTNFTNSTQSMRIDIPESQPFLNNSTQSMRIDIPESQPILNNLTSLPVPSNQTVGKPNPPTCSPSRDSNSHHHRHPQESTDCGSKNEGEIPYLSNPKDNNNRKACDTPMMASYQNRLDTFKKWPHHSISPRDVSRAGLYMTGKGDSVQCFTCDVILKSWKPTDDPFTEHQKWSPNCSYIAEKYSKSKTDNISKVPQQIAIH
ncbi:uncharacterized protein LOC126815350 [Patella vulgata]|uniref:uncharacterized protein LOC126815350 n=1 Tax=Patella vulgata TaxID=6465 RepID=UPI0024A90F7F|nr:uncharacterized protein LOC126815350 [Patella vulgata]